MTTERSCPNRTIVYARGFSKYTVHISHNFSPHQWIRVYVHIYSPFRHHFHNSLLTFTTVPPGPCSHCENRCTNMPSKYTGSWILNSFCLLKEKSLLYFGLAENRYSCWNPPSFKKYHKLTPFLVMDQAPGLGWVSSLVWVTQVTICAKTTTTRILPTRRNSTKR